MVKLYLLINFMSVWLWDISYNWENWGWLEERNLTQWGKRKLPDNLSLKHHLSTGCFVIATEYELRQYLGFIVRLCFQHSSLIYFFSPFLFRASWEREREVCNCKGIHSQRTQNRVWGWHTRYHPITEQILDMQQLSVQPQHLCFFYITSDVFLLMNFQ